MSISNTPVAGGGPGIMFRDSVQVRLFKTLGSDVYMYVYIQYIYLNKIITRT